MVDSLDGSEDDEGVLEGQREDDDGDEVLRVLGVLAQEELDFEWRQQHQLRRNHLELLDVRLVELDEVVQDPDVLVLDLRGEKLEEILDAHDRLEDDLQEGQVVHRVVIGN